jgi:hypothetical protein
MIDGHTMPDWVADVVRMRATVGALGETDSREATAHDQSLRCWWTSRATSEAGRAALTQLFPRTAVSAALATVSRAAGAVHDERIRQPRVIHLFRLPVSEEAIISRWIAEADGHAIITEAFDLDWASRLSRLRAFAAEASTGSHVPGGPYRVEVDAGDVRSLRGRTLRRACAVYAAAFASGTQAFPFIDATVTEETR